MAVKELQKPVLSETYCGSYAYAPPEILTGKPYVAQLADIWSMGVVLYVMVFGRLPFEDSNHKKLLKQVHSGPIYPDNSDVSKECHSLISKILTDRRHRITIKQIRQEPWFIKMCPPPNDVIEASTVKMASDASSRKLSDSDSTSKKPSDTASASPSGSKQKQNDQEKNSSSTRSSSSKAEKKSTSGTKVVKKKSSTSNSRTKLTTGEPQKEPSSKSKTAVTATLVA